MNTFFDLLVSSILLAGLYMTMSFGLTMIYGVMKIINLAHAGVIMLGAYLTYTLYHTLGIDPILSLVINLPLFFLFGMFIHRVFVSRVPLADVPTLPSLLLLFGIWLILQNIAYLIWSGNDRSIMTAYTTSTFQILGAHVSLIRVIVFVISILALIFLQLFLSRTYMGKAIRAITQNRNSARLAGIDVERISMVAFGIGIAFAALAGTLMSTMYSFNPDFGRTFLLKAFVIIVLGGLESFYGVAIGALLLALFESYSALFIQASLQPAISFTLLVVILIFLPGGITGLLQRRRKAA
ncbi:branched-chain amino acid ABC transporter permease [Effusibacillus dendaii]|uniref:Branched-chain amino acid ABC transporter permease n=1 Tax=Effusibacillus dendaii TaxID=2743772 RepID=A0A7I8D788_9BACL|nr:branched-chain amino acid ABC transporter permease [Effusibacillus dendaii]BCJ86023.1 branched-chain amino acid ABC transporter permease [Effusibacillus dendaii]